MKENTTYQYFSAISFRDRAPPPHVRQISVLYILPVNTIKTPTVFQLQLKMKRHFTKAHPMPVKQFATKRKLWKDSVIKEEDMLSMMRELPRDEQ